MGEILSVHNVVDSHVEPETPAFDMEPELIIKPIVLGAAGIALELIKFARNSRLSHIYSTESFDEVRAATVDLGSCIDFAEVSAGNRKIGR